MAIDADKQPIRPVLSLLSKGRTGTGKTIASCGKEFRPVYVFNLEQRFEPVIDYYRKLDGHVKGVHYDNYTMKTGYHPMDQKMDAIAARPEYKTVVFASLTSYIHIVLRQLMGVTPSRSARMKGGIQANILEDFNFEDAAIIFELCAFLQEIKDQGTNVILEAHISPYEITTINEDSRQRETQTIMQVLTKGKKAPAQIPGYFNEVYLFEKKFEGIQAGASKAHYWVNSIGSQIDECKTSMGIKPFDFTDKDFSEILWSQISQEIKDTARVDPNAPKRISF